MLKVSFHSGEIILDKRFIYLKHSFKIFASLKLYLLLETDFRFIFSRHHALVVILPAK